MMCQFLNHPCDVQWLRDVHLAETTPAFKSAIIYGNEDAPTKIELYAERMPRYDEQPITTIERN